MYKEDSRIGSLYINADNAQGVANELNRVYFDELADAGVWIGLTIVRRLIPTEDVEDWQSLNVKPEDLDTHPLVIALRAVDAALETKFLTEQDWNDLDELRRTQGKSPLKRDGRTIPTAYMLTLVPRLREVKTPSGRVFFE